MAKADGVEVQRHELFQGLHGLFRRLGDARGRGIEPQAELVLKGVAYNDYAFIGQVKGDAACSVAREMDYAHLRGEGDDVSILQAEVDGHRAACEPSKSRSGHVGQELGPEEVWRGDIALDNVRFGAVDGDGNTGFGYKLSEAA